MHGVHQLRSYLHMHSHVSIFPGDLADAVRARAGGESTPARTDCPPAVSSVRGTPVARRSRDVIRKALTSVWHTLSLVILSAGSSPLGRGWVVRRPTDEASRDTWAFAGDTVSECKPMSKITALYGNNSG